MAVMSKALSEANEGISHPIPPPLEGTAATGNGMYDTVFALVS
jgi:hypothetical protein